MTTPSQPQQQPSQGQQDTTLALAAASALAGAATVAEAMVILGPVFVSFKIKRAALRAALNVVMSYPPDRAGFYGPATAQTARLNLMRRAQFLVASSRRFTLAQFRGPEAMFEQMAAERRYYGQHQEALWNRMQAAAQVDTAVMDHGVLLGWYTKRDSKTSPECITADRHNFRADQMPAIGFPGAVHLHCRCMPGPPFPRAPVLGSRRVRV
jgi:hypothetical protein